VRQVNSCLSKLRTKTMSTLQSGAFLIFSKLRNSSQTGVPGGTCVIPIRTLKQTRVGLPIPPCSNVLACKELQHWLSSWWNYHLLHLVRAAASKPTANVPIGFHNEQKIYHSTSEGGWAFYGCSTVKSDGQKSWAKIRSIFGIERWVYIIYAFTLGNMHFV
jgi:hypothetical protein